MAGGTKVGVRPGTVMVTQRIDNGEWYPVYFFTGSNTYGNEVELTAEQYARFTRVFDEFKEVQAELKAMFQGANT